MATGDEKRGINLDWAAIRKKTEAEIAARAAARKRKQPAKAEVEARLAAEEREEREDKATHEISNKSLKGYVAHRRKHRGEEFVDDGGSTSANGKIVKKRRRVDHDAKLLQALGDERWEAMALIRSAYQMIAAGMGMRTFNPFRTGGGSVNDDAGRALMQLYWKWARQVQERRLSHAMCICVCVEGMTLNGAAEAYRKDKRTIKENLVLCLDIAVKMGILRLNREGD